jgi:nitroimidazol reductase NimA-like FMN-containing flavoprotein (pyridoxamine 5'-phosphate oxidase superfamily)
MDSLSDLGELLRAQRFAVLATESGGQPHGCLVAFAEEDNLRCLLFATSRNTRKFHDIKANPRVALLVDNRSNNESDFENAVAVTARGSALEASGQERERAVGLYLAKHPRLAGFIGSADTALIKVSVDEYIVAAFEGTHTLKPG